MSDAPASPPASARPDLWAELREVVRIVLQVFGDPAVLLEDLVLPRAEARRLAAWLASLEAAARALLAALAATLPAHDPARRRGARPSAARARADAGGAIPPTDDLPAETPPSDRWARVAFRIAPRASGGGAGGGAPGDRRFLSVRGLAFRLEALIRVAANPEPFARRLARRLRAEPGLAARALRRPRGSVGRPPPYDELLDDALAAAREAWPAFAADTG